MSESSVQTLAQVSVFLENRPGTLARATRVLGAAGVNLRALMIAETEKYGIMRIIPEDTDAAVAALTEAGFTTRLTDVLGVQVPDHAGGLAEVLDALAAGGVNVEYMYAELAGRNGNALLVMKLAPLEAALTLLA